MKNAAPEATALVTGGAGFLGSALVRRLLTLGWRKVYVLDDFSTGCEGNLPVTHSNLRLIKADLAKWNSDDWVRTLDGVDYVFHLAACKHHVTADDPGRLWRTNVDATYSLLRGCQQAQVQRAVFASSLYVYGRRQLPAMSEEERIEPTSLYGISKLTGERLLDYFSECSDFTTLSLRLFFVYGPGQNINKGYPSVIVKTSERLLSGRPALITGDGSQEFDYVYIDDVVEAFLKGMESQVDRERINIGSGQATTIHNLASILSSHAGCTLPPEHMPPDDTAGTCRVCFNEKAEKLLGWKPRTSLEAGLLESWRWMKHTHENQA